MSEINVVTATFGSLRKAMTMPIMYQHDVVQMLKIRGLDLPTYFEVEFCNEGDTTTINITGSAAEGAQIPESLIQTGRRIKAYIVLTYQDSVQTRYEITIPVYRRPLRNDIDPTDDQQLQIDALVAALNDAINRAEAVEDLLEGGDEEQILRKNSDDDLDFSWTDETKEIFWATYGTTTKAEIETALANNLFVCCKYNSTVYFLSDRFVQGASIFTYTFVGMTTTDGLYIGPQIKYLKLVYTIADGGTNTWSNGTRIVPDLATDTPSALGTAAVGTSKKVARSDHVHSMPTAADVGAIADPGSGTTGQVLKKTANGTEWANESGGGGTSDYDDLTDKPSINSVTLSGNKSTSDLGLDQVFWATYGTTTNAQIDAAHSAGKVVLVDRNGMIAPLTEISVGDDFAEFVCVYGGTAYTIGCESDTWSMVFRSILPDENTVSTAGDVTKALDAGKIYHFTGALTSLTLTLTAPASGNLAQYHFDFDSGSTAPTLTLPNTVTMPSGFQVEASKHYEIDILDGYGVAQSW